MARGKGPPLAKPNLLVIFNHTLTTEQIEDAGRSLGIGEIILPPPEVAAEWSQVPAGMTELHHALAATRAWLTATAKAGDFVLVQGDFGATYLLVRFALERGWIPIYSTTVRQAHEITLPSGEVRVSHDFRHQIFRRYGA